MRALIPQTGRPSRAVAWCLAFLSLWMATLGVVHHTDRLSVGHSSSARAAWGLPTAAVPADDLCAACQWTQAVRTGAVALFVLCLPLATTLRHHIARRQLLLARAPLDASPRAPPVLSVA